MSFCILGYLLDGVASCNSSFILQSRHIQYLRFSLRFCCLPSRKGLQSTAFRWFSASTQSGCTAPTKAVSINQYDKEGLLGSPFELRMSCPPKTTQCLQYDSDIAGLGVRLSFYFQNFILGIE